MGINYFLTLNDGTVYHIGKKSMGIKFIFNCSKFSIHDWFTMLKRGVIFDEYNNKITLDEMISIIKAKGKDPENVFCDDNGYFYVTRDFF